MRPTWSEPLASPFGCWSLADASSSLAVLAAPQATTTMSAAKRSVSPSRSTTTAATSFPDPFVSSLTTRAFVSSVTFGCSSAGRTPSTSASDLAWTRQGKPSHVAQRMQWLYGRFVSVSRTPHGAWNGW